MRSTTSSTGRLLGAVLTVVLAGLLLAACGSSSSKTSTAAAGSTSAKSPAAPGGRAPSSARFDALRACLQKQGITLPSRKPGSRPPAGGAFGQNAGGPQLPKGVTRSQFGAALKKCGGAAFGGRGVPGAHFNRAGLRKSLAKYATCLRENGIDVPAPNTSGKGPVFNIKGLKTSSPKFVKAEEKCSGILRGAFRGAPGARRPGTSGTAPAPLGGVPAPKS